MNIDDKLIKQLFYNLEDCHLDKLTMEVVFNINNEEFQSELITAYEKSFNVSTNEKYEKNNSIINELKALQLNLNDDFIIGIKNTAMVCKLNTKNLKVVKIRCNQN